MFIFEVITVYRNSFKAKISSYYYTQHLFTHEVCKLIFVAKASLSYILYT